MIDAADEMGGGEKGYSILNGKKLNEQDKRRKIGVSLSQQN